MVLKGGHGRTSGSSLGKLRLWLPLPPNFNRVEDSQPYEGVSIRRCYWSAADRRSRYMVLTAWFPKALWSLWLILPKSNEVIVNGAQHHFYRVSASVSVLLGRPERFCDMHSLWTINRNAGHVHFAGELPRHPALHSVVAIYLEYNCPKGQETGFCSALIIIIFGDSGEEENKKEKKSWTNELVSESDLKSLRNTKGTGQSMFRIFPFIWSYINPQNN